MMTVNDNLVNCEDCGIECFQYPGKVSPSRKKIKFPYNFICFLQAWIRIWNTNPWSTVQYFPHEYFRPAYGLNVLSMTKHQTLVLTEAAVEHITRRLLFALHRCGAPPGLANLCYNLWYRSESIRYSISLRMSEIRELFSLNRTTERTVSRIAACEHASIFQDGQNGAAYFQHGGPQGDHLKIGKT